jgi:hypothetical protein
MIQDYAEARNLGLENVPLRHDLAQPDFLEIQCPVTPLFPPILPHRPDGYLVLDLDAVNMMYLARHLPAVTVDFLYHTYVTADGYIKLRSGRGRADEEFTQACIDTPIINADQWEPEDDKDFRASYRLEKHDQAKVLSAQALIQGRKLLAAAHENEGGQINPTCYPETAGRWTRFDRRSDSILAREQGFEDDSGAITHTRAAGRMSSSFESSDDPSVVFYPDRAAVTTIPDIHEQRRR